MKSKKAKKKPNSLVRFLGESTARQSALFYLNFIKMIIGSYNSNSFAQLKLLRPDCN